MSGKAIKKLSITKEQEISIDGSCTDRDYMNFLRNILDITNAMKRNISMAFSSRACEDSIDSISISLN